VVESSTYDPKIEGSNPDPGSGRRPMVLEKRNGGKKTDTTMIP
jgi:hypothetical protein